MSNAITGIGTKFQRWNGSTWTPIAEIFAITGPGHTRSTVDVTNFDSPNGYREFIAGLRDGGTVQLSMNFTREGYDLMKADFESDDLQNYEIVLPDVEETSFEFAGLVTELPLTVSMDDKISVEVTIKVSGEVVVNSGSGSST